MNKQTLMVILFALFSTTLFSQHLKKDGTPDRRYKENKTTYFTSTTPKTSSAKFNKSLYSTGVQRDTHGKINRSAAATRAFKKLTGYPHGRPGYVIDHIVPLKEGGCDCPENMQWQTKEEAKAKDKVER